MRRQPHFFWRKAAVSCVSLALVGALAGVPAAEACIPWLTARKSPSTGVTLVQGADTPDPIAAGDYEAQEKRREENPVDEAFYAGMNRFAYQTACALLTGKGNENYSPASLYYALSLAGLGAGGETQTQILNLLGVEDTAYLTRQVGNLYRTLYCENETGSLRLANSLWLAQGSRFRTSFTQAAAGQLYAAVYEADFTNPSTSQAIGKWIGDNTGGLIAEGPEVNPATRALLLNTVYFTSPWMTSFQAERNTQGVFHAPEGDVEATYMHKAEQGSFVLGDGWRRASLALQNGTMTFVLPDEGTSVAELLSAPEKLAEALAGGEEHYGEVYWQMPKFDFSAELDLRSTLQTLGVTDAFTPGAADFSNMAEEALYIDNATQQTRIKLDENGVAAAAYTALGFMRMALPIENMEMTLDRPFLYAITAEDGTLLFVGVCGNPAE